MDVTAVAPGLVPGLEAYRKRIRRSRRVRYLALSFAGVGALWLLASLVYYFSLPLEGAPLLAIVGTLALPAAALLVEVLRRPSLAETADAVDRRLDNRQRLLTAVELLDRPERDPLTEAQVVSSAALLSRLEPRAVYPMRTPWPLVSGGSGLLLLALGLFVLKGAGGGFAPIQAGILPPDQAVSSALASPTPQSNLPESEMTPSPEASPSAGPTEVALGGGQQSDAGDLGTPVTTDASGQPVPTDPQSQQEASQQAQSGLDRLGEALDEQSATQPAGDSLRQGDPQAAAEELRKLGEESDQLSDEAKRDLAQSLERAAREIESNPQLREALRKAANALREGSYRDVAAQMDRLADALEGTAADVVPQEELAKSFPSPTALAAAESGDSSQGGEQGGQSQSAQEAGEGGEGEGQQGEQGQQSGEGSAGEGGEPGEEGSDSGAGAQGGAPSANQEGEGQSGAPGQGTRIGGPTESNPQNVAGNPFELEGRPDPNSGSPQDPSQNRPGLELEGGSGASMGAVPASPGGTVDTPGESNSLPLDRWEIIRRYFTPGGR